MNETSLTPEKILDTAEEVLRRFGPAKATVVDVARALGVSHGSVYRHFSSKAALRDAVAERWLSRVSVPLALIANEKSAATERLRRWFDVLIAFKHKKNQEDPELFATYHQLALESRDVVWGHIEKLVSQISQIVTDGKEQGEFAVSDPKKAGRAVFYATVRFHDPTHRGEWSNPEIQSAFESVWLLIMAGLGVRGRFL